MSHTPHVGRFFTKPLQSSLYEVFSKIIMRRSSINVLLQDSSFPLKERVENRRICQVVSGNSATTNGQESYAGATESQTNRLKT